MQVDINALWDETKTEFARAYRDLVGFAIASIEAILIVAAAVVVARALRRRVRRSLARTLLGANIGALAANGVSIGVYVLAATFVLGLFGANWTALLAVLSVSTVAISLALQDVLKNFVAGVYVLLERPFSIGDRIRIRDFEGKVEGIDIRTTVLRNVRGERVLVPNATVFSEILVNRSSYRVGQTTVTVEGLQIPLSDVEPAIRRTLDGLTDGAGQPPEVLVQKASDEGATVRVVVWHAAETEVEPRVIARLRERFPEATVATTVA